MSEPVEIEVISEPLELEPGYLCHVSKVAIYDVESLGKKVILYYLKYFNNEKNVEENFVVYDIFK
jgi:hypothetical protein